jgi:hypothetical protein
LERFVKRLEHDATGAQRNSFKVFKNLKSGRTDKAKIDLISETKWKEYYQEMLRNEEENDQTDTIQVNEFNKISIADLEKALKT